MTGFPITRRRALLASAQAAALAALAQGGSLTDASPAAAAPGGKVLNAFDYRGVRLLPSRWQAQQQAVLDYYLYVPTDDYLRGFRIRAGKPVPPSRELGGWYSDDLFNPFGQIVSGLARFHAATGRQDAKNKVHALVAGFRECIGPGGYFRYSNSTHAPHYAFDKALCGMLDAWLYCGDTNGRDAMTTITWWAAANLSQARPYGYDGSEWYTLTENLYRAYLATGNTGFLDVGRTWEYRGFWDHFHPAPGEDWFRDPTNGQQRPWYHAYSHVNSLNGLGAGFLARGTEYYRTALINAHDAIRASQTYATGGYGPNEVLLKGRPKLREMLRRPHTHTHFETQCGSWAVFKLAKYLLQITGDARFGDWAEQMLYNGVGASIQNTLDGGVQYFSDYSARGGTKFTMNPWSCCAGTRPQVIADYTDMVFLHAPGQLCVNLFLPATVDWPGAGVRARLDTTFPESDVVRLTIQHAPASNLAVKFRSPGWLAGTPTAKLNGTPITITADTTRHWLVVNRTWQANDVLEVALPTGSRPRLTRFDPASEYPAAMVQGPVVLAYGATINPARTTTPQSIVNSLQRIPGTLDYRIGAQGSAVVRPYYKYQLGERYFMHLDPTAGPYVTFTGTWLDAWVEDAVSYSATWSYTNAVGSAAEAEFEGTGIRLRWQWYDNSGFARVEIDGRLIGTVDQFGPQQGGAASVQYTGLAPGRHRVRIVCTGTNGPLSKGAFINLQNIEDLGPEAATQVSYSGPWNLNQHLAYTNTTGSAAEVEVTGNGIRWRWERYNDAGFARVEIDGQVKAMVDMYGDRGTPAQSDFTGLGAGRHRIRITCTGTKQGPSSGTNISILGPNLLPFIPLP